MTSTRWLDEEEQRTWRAFLAANRLLLDRLDRQLQNEAGIPHTYYEILVRLSEVPGNALRMSQLAASAMSSRSRLSHAVSRLEEAGWVRRKECETDKRGAVCELTKAGRRALEAAAPGHVEAVRNFLFDQLTREQVLELRVISEAIAKRLGGEGLWPLGDNGS